MKQLAGCSETSPCCPGVHDDGDPKTVIVIGSVLPIERLTWQEQVNLRIGSGEIAVRVPRTIIIDAAQKLLPVIEEGAKP